MRMRFLACVAIAVMALLAGASGASGATEFGDNCVADQDFVAPGTTLFERSAPGNPLPPAAPSAGVITKLKIAVVPVPFSFPQTVKLLRLNTASHSAQVIAEATPTISAGQNSIDARIPVQAGDQLSLFGDGEPDTLICEKTGGGGVIAGFAGNGGGVGSTAPYAEAASPIRIPVAGVIEPDADGDGYGDETQDKCPQSAAVQVECPVIVVDSFPLASKSSIVVLVAASETGPVTVTANAKLPKVKKKASSSAKAKFKKVTRSVTAGKIARFKLKFPGRLKSTLRKLPRGKSITVRLQATATNVAGQVSKDKAKLKLKPSKVRGR